MTDTAMLVDAEVFADVLSSGTGEFDPDAARAVLRLGFSEAQKARMKDLAARHNRGELDESEREEMESFRRVGNFLALLHSKARLSLKHDGSRIG